MRNNCVFYRYKIYVILLGLGVLSFVVIILLQIYSLSSKNHDFSLKNSSFQITKDNSELKKKHLHTFESMERRINKIKEYCENNTKEKNIQYGVLKRLIVDNNDGISWCPIYKASSTVWMKIFAIVGGEIDLNTEGNGIQMNKLARKAFPYLGVRSVYQSLNKITKFIIVRHPFERLLSAYRDKLENLNMQYYYKKFSLHIIKWYRKGNNELKYPTFEEFLLYIMHEKEFDEHWKPYYLECAPCFVNYNFILKVETFDRDHEYFINYLGVKSIEEAFKKSKTENKNILGITNTHVIQKYYSQISIKLLRKIFYIYRKDFELFEYSPEEYYNLTEDNHEHD